MMKTREETAEKYSRLLRKLVVDVNENGFSLSKWIIQNKVSGDFGVAAAELKFIIPESKVGNRTIWRSEIKPSDISGGDVLDITEKTYQLGRVRNKVLKEATEPTKNDELPAKSIDEKFDDFSNLVQDYLARLAEKLDEKPDFKPISEIPTLNLIEELKRRGFDGTISKIEEYVLDDRK